ncbi:MAG: response regulator [Kofleriaceae bacterium]
MARALHGIAVLIVEDDPDGRELMALGLAAVGADVRSAESAEAALAVLADWRPHVILCDLQLPGIDGYTFLELLRANPRLRSIPAVALSGAYSNPIAEIPGASFDKLLRKPSKLPEIVLALATLAGSSEEPSVANDQPSSELRAVLEQLNTASGCRYTSLLLFDEDDTLRSLWTYDRDRPKQDPFPLGLPVHASYCVLVRDAGAMCTVEDAKQDPRTVNHPKRDELARYVGAPLFKPDGRMFGTVCCYDSAPRAIDQPTRDAVASAAREIEPWLVALLDE